ncbi:MAG TPA: hypothetical protein VGR70_10025, partial [Stellaceae bacterium]|nr:hypothetical protein [Stellaceae bacterium]
MDFGFIFDFLFIAALVLIFALPVTTAIMAGLGIAAYRIRRRDPARRLTALKWTAIAIGPFWIGGIVLGSLFLVSEIRSHIETAQRYFTLDKAAEVDGAALPAGTTVTLDESHALLSAELPPGATATLRGASWQGKIEFAEPAHAPDAKHGQVNQGTLAADATIDAVPCRAGSEVTFFWGGQLMGCTLSQDTEIAATLAKPDGATQTQKLRCLANDTVKLDNLRAGELEGCRLAETADFGEVSCAANERVLIINDQLAGCTFARA